MGNWTDRFDPETVDEIKRCEVGEGDFSFSLNVLPCTKAWNPYLAFMLIA